METSLLVQQLVQAINKGDNSSLALCVGNPSTTGGLPRQRVSNSESDALSWRSYDVDLLDDAHRPSIG